MKNSILAIALVALVVGFVSCGSKPNPEPTPVTKSDKCEITAVVDSNTEGNPVWTKGTGDNWVGKYDKTASMARTVTITISEKATVASTTITFAAEEEKSCIVTAEDGTTKKTWKLKIEKRPAQ